MPAQETVKASPSTTKPLGRSLAAAALKAKKDALERGERTPSRVYRIEKKSDGRFSRVAVNPETQRRKSAKASPKNKGLIEKRDKKGALAAKATYLIRDTMKVTGHSEMFPKPVCALFYVDLNDPFAGGTGHTIRVCQQEGVPFAFQDSWQQWFPR